MEIGMSFAFPNPEVHVWRFRFQVFGQPEIGNLRPETQARLRTAPTIFHHICCICRTDE